MGEDEFYKEDWSGVSIQVQDLIQKLLVVDPSERLTAEQALRHEWIVDISKSDLSSNDLSDSIIDKMRELLKVS